MTTTRHPNSPTPKDTSLLQTIHIILNNKCALAVLKKENGRDYFNVFVFPQFEQNIVSDIRACVIVHVESH